MNIQLPEPRFPIGTRYMSRGRHPRLCTIVDIYYTFNAKGEFVKLRYVSTHEFAGQTIREIDIVETTITIGEIK